MNQYDHLKDKLHQYKVGVDKDKLWEKTSHAIPQRKRRRAVLLMLFAGLVVSGWLLHSASRPPLSPSSASIHSTGNNHHDQLAQHLEVTASGTPVEMKESTQNPTELLSSNLSLSVSKTISPERPVVPENNSLLRSEENPKSLQPAVYRSINMQNNDQATEKDLRTPLKTSSMPVQPLSPEGRQTKFDRFLEAPLSIAEPEAYGPLNSLFKDISTIPLSENQIVVTGSHNPNIRPLQKQLVQSFQMVQGVGFSTVKIHSLAPESAQLAAQLEQKMRSLEILSTSATATFNLPERFSLETGLQWTRLSSVIDHEWETTERIQQEGVSTITIDENGVPYSIIGDTYISRTTHYQAKRFTTHSKIDIVLGLHKVIWKSGRTSLDAFIRGAYNLSYNVEGTTIRPDGELMSFSTSDNPFRLQSPFAIGGGLQMKYQLHPHWNLTSALTFDQLSYQLSDESIPVRFNHSGLAFGLGVGYIF